PARHEVDEVGRDDLGRRDEVALVLAVLVVDDDDELAVADVVEGVLDGVEEGALGHGDLGRNRSAGQTAAGRVGFGAAGEEPARRLTRYPSRRPTRRRSCRSGA